MGKEIIFLILAWGEKGKREKKEGGKRGSGEPEMRGNGDQRERIRRKGEQEEAHG
jgi:hypothetical protein